MLLLAFPAYGKKSERYYQEIFADEVNGSVEVVMSDGTRCDILTETHAIEVDFARKWAEAIGQSLNYSTLTGKIPGVLLILEKDSDEKYLAILENIIEKKNLGIEVFLVLAEDESTSSTETIGEHIVVLQAIGKINRLILSDEGKSPKVFHEFLDITIGWSKELPFTDAFRCYATSLENLRFSVDGGPEKEVTGVGEGNFRWGKLTKKYWISSSGKTHTKKCKYFGTTKAGRYSEKPSEDPCKICNK